MPEIKKTVLMTHLDRFQGEIWQIALMHQGFEVIWDASDVDLVERLEQLRRSLDLPDLLLMDSGLKKPSAEILQAGSVCQWVKQNQMPLKVILFTPRSDRIKEVEYSWAIRRGASDVLPRLTGENLVTLVSRITDILGCTFARESVECLADRIILDKSVLDQSSDSAATLSRQKAEPIDIDSLVVKNQAATADESGFMYRGVRIRK